MFRKPETTTEMASTNWKSSRIVKKNANIDRIFIKEETKAHVKKVSYNRFISFSYFNTRMQLFNRLVLYGVNCY